MYYFCNKYFAFDFKKINISTDHKKYAIICTTFACSYK